MATYGYALTGVVRLKFPCANTREMLVAGIIQIVNSIVSSFYVYTILENQAT